MKALVFVGTSLADISTLSEDGRRDVGRDLSRLQHGLESPHGKPLPTVGPDVFEMRVRTGTENDSAFYITHIDDVIYVLHASTKMTNKTPHADIYIGQKRLMAIQQLRLHRRRRSRPGYIMPDRTDPVTRGNVTLTRSSGNVFEDLGFPEDEAHVFKMRLELMVAIERMIKEQQLTQSEVVEILRVAQSRISDLRRGRIEKFSLDMLVTFIARMGYKIRLLLPP